MNSSGGHTATFTPSLTTGAKKFTALGDQDLETVHLSAHEAGFSVTGVVVAELFRAHRELERSSGRLDHERRG